jgi:hypothetical protein
MKKLFQILFFAALVTILANTAVAQGSAGWRMVLNNDNSAFTIHIYNNEMTFYFSPKADTLSVSLNNNKPIKDGYTVEVTLRNSKKALYTTTEKNLSPGKAQIVVPMADVYKAVTGQKLPSKPKYTLSIMDKTTVKEKINFEFKE